MDRSEDIAGTARFFDRAISEFMVCRRPPPIRVLDFGCGSGDLVAGLTDLGYDAYGCDVTLDMTTNDRRFRQIDSAPYRIPFNDDWFDVVVSSSVLEHARNPHEYLPEVRRVLRPHGIAMHLFPGKWYLPYEPHILVPLANYFYPHCPTWWFSLWALTWRPHPVHSRLRWRDAVVAWRTFYDNNVCYLSTREHQRLSRAVFGNCEWPMTFYIAHGHGMFARLARRLPMPNVWGLLSREFRMAFLLQRKLG